MAGPGLLAHVLVAKYADHLPLYRQSDIYEREGIELSRSTLSGWVGGASRTLEPLVDAIRDYVLEALKLHGDDTPVPVLAPGNGKTQTGRLWTYVQRNEPQRTPPGRKTAEHQNQASLRVDLMADRRLYAILARHFFNKFSTEAKRKKKNQKER